MAEQDMPVKALSADDLQILIDEGGSVLVDIWASWCGPCRAMLPLVETLAQERAGHLHVAKLQIDDPEAPQNHDWIREFGVQSLPTFILFDKGQDIAGFAGTATLAALHQWLDKKLPG